MGRRFASTSAVLVLAASLVLGGQVPTARACDEPGVTCSADQAPPAALAPGAGERCEAAPVVTPQHRQPARRRAAFVPLNPNGYNQGGAPPRDLAEAVQRLERERSQAKAEARR